MVSCCGCANRQREFISLGVGKNIRVVGEESNATSCLGPCSDVRLDHSKHGGVGSRFNRCAHTRDTSRFRGLVARGCFLLYSRLRGHYTEKFEVVF